MGKCTNGSGLSGSSSPTHSLSSVVTFKRRDLQILTSFHSKPPVTPKEGHQRRPTLCLRMGSQSVSTALETLNLETGVTKDEERPRLCEEEDGQSCEEFGRRRDGGLQRVRMMFASDFARSWLSILVIYNISSCVCLRPKISGCCIFVVAIANACVKQRVVHNQCSHPPPCFSPTVRECATVLSQF